MNIATIAEMAAQGRPDGAAIGPLRAAVSYAELYARSSAVAGWLAGRGVTRVLYVGTNSVTAPTLLFACALGGAVYAPLNYRLADTELAALVARNTPCLVVTGDGMDGRIRPAPSVEIVPDRELATIAAGATDEAMTVADDVDGVAALIHTSGTSGAPKAAVLRHRHLSAYVLSTVEFMGADPGEAAVVSLPPYHVAGVCAILTGVFAGRRMLYLDSFDPAGWIDLVRAEGVTHAMVVPTMLERILDVLAGTGERLPLLRHLSYGGGRMPLPVIERALRLLPHVGFVNAYGLTETSSTIAVLTAEDHRAAEAAADPAVRRRLGSVGRPIPTLEVEIRDEAGRPVPAGRSGEVYVRGEQVAGEYLGGAGPAHGWFATRDGGYLDEDGYLYLLGRLDDVIVRGGENISPGEIEDVLLRHPAVAEAAAIGIPDVEWGEAVAAVVVLDPLAPVPPVAELQDWTRAALRSSRVPGRIVFADALPYGDTGKVLRRALKERYAGLATAGEPS
jgi:fatty-acyl-CoA synthase